MMASSSRPAKEAEGENTTGPNWLDLPRDVTARILLKLGVVDIVTSACLVCPLWWNICKDPLMWRTIDMTNLSTLPYDLGKICRYAVDQSCGHVEDISIGFSGTDELLRYIANRACNLQHIRLAYCLAITDKGLSEVAKKFPLLEELDISYSNLSEDSLEVIGRSCPLLKTLKFNVMPYKGNGCDAVAFVIAQNMPKLCQLQLIDNKLTNDGLSAILIGCPHLESLDLRRCSNVDLCGSLGKRCAEHVKDLKLPDDNLTDCYNDSDDYLYSDYDFYELYIMSR